jgi:NhaP-type Na+/H+ or K+/H+ antiporter
VLGCATLYALSRASGPFRFLSYEPVLLVEGILLSVLDRQSGHGLGALSRSLASWQAIDAHMILYGFLPALLFGDAMHLNTHTFTRCAAQCVILAVPGVVIGTALTAASTHWIGLGWSWPLLFAFGAIASATDPVAVVSLLKNLGASRVLTMQITGESLLNDGTAIVIFTVCYDGVKHPLKTFSLGGVASTLARMALGGPLVGWCAGRLLLAGIRTADQKTKHDDALLQLMLTIGVAYLTFFAAEAEFHVSGVLATVVAGLVVAKHAGPAFVSRQAMEHFWEAIEYAANTLVFLLAGVLIGAFMYEDIGATHWAMLLVLYVFANLIRAAMVAMCYPALRRCGYSTTPEQAAFMVWGGLRGAVGLALALFAKQDLVQFCSCAPKEAACMVRSTSTFSYLQLYTYSRLNPLLVAALPPLLVA